MKTDVKINVHIISARHSSGSQYVLAFKNDSLFSAQYVLRLIFIDALIKFKIFFLII